MIYRSPLPDIEIPNVSLPDFVMQRFEARAEKPALIDGPSGRTLTYGQLAGGIRKVAAGLAARGFGKGDVLAIYSPNLPEYALAFYGASLAGGAVTTVNPLYTAHELAHQLGDASARFVVTVPPFLEKVQEAGVEEIFVLGEAEGATPFAALMEGDHPAPNVTIDPAEDLVALPYSSGTTGLSKGVMLTHRNVVANVMQTEALEKVGEGDRLIGILPFYHIYGMTVILSIGLHAGTTIVTMPRFELEQFLELMQEHAITSAYLVPPIVLALGKHPLVDAYDLSSLDAITSGAAPLSEEVANACAERLGCIVKQGYGMTEMSPVSHMNPPNMAIKPAAAGVLVPNTECRIVDVETGEDVSGPGERGELLVRGPQVMKGYLGNRGATDATLDADGWLRTGDVALADEDEYFYVVDRVKELIKYKGFQVPPAELEAVLLTHDDVTDAGVIPVPDEEAGEIPKAFVVRREGASLTEDALMDYVAERVAPQKKIRRVEFIAEIPKTASGKILRRELAEREAA